MNFNCKEYKLDKKIQNKSVVNIFSIIFCMLCIVLVIDANGSNITIFCLIIMFFSLFREIRFFRIINNQKYCKLILDSNNYQIKLIDKNNNVINIEINNIKKIQIKKIANRPICDILCYSFANVEFIGNESYNIIISDVDDFIKNINFQNIVITENCNYKCMSKWKGKSLLDIIKKYVL